MNADETSMKGARDTKMRRSAALRWVSIREIRSQKNESARRARPAKAGPLKGDV